MHFSIMVAAEDEGAVEKVLAPFQENNMGDCPAEYMTFEDCTAEIQEEYDANKDTVKNLLKLADGTFMARNDHTLWDKDKHEYVYPDGAVEVSVPFYEVFPTVDDYARNDYYIQVDGVWGRMYNPNAHWDWWQIGGRWMGTLRIKDGAARDSIGRGRPGVMGSPNMDPDFCDGLPKSALDIEWHKSRPAQNAASQWDEYQKIKGEGESAIRDWAFNRVGIFSMSKMGDLAAMTRDDYIAKHSRNTTICYGFVDAEGKWIERDGSKEFDDAYETAFWSWIDGLSDDTMIFMVDCHI